MSQDFARFDASTANETCILPISKTLRRTGISALSRKAAWRRWIERSFDNAMEMNLQLIQRAAAESDSSQNGLMLDLGCSTGETTVLYRPPGREVFGSDQDIKAGAAARRLGISFAASDVNHKLPFKSQSFDIVTSNQVIEHLHDTDTFVSEARRVLKPGGRFVVSTENLASWHNIFALSLGWQAFSLTNVSSAAPGLGNPASYFRDDRVLPRGWAHLRVFSFRGLKELLEAHGFSEVRVMGAGYYPLPASLGRGDPRHSAFIVGVGMRK
jgi:SAM-dependent methyltransferase